MTISYFFCSRVKYKKSFFFLKIFIINDNYINVDDPEEFGEKTADDSGGSARFEKEAIGIL